MEEKTLANVNSNLPAGINEELAAKLRAGSGEGQTTYNFVPVVEIDNSTEKKIVDGNEEDILCQPRWKITRQIDGELVSEPFNASFGGVVLVIKYRVQKKYEPSDKQTMPFFYSNEFSPAVFQNGDQISLKFENDIVEYLTYKEFKAKYADKYVLIATVYTWYNNEVIRVKLKKSGLSAFWEYLKNFKGKDSVSLHGTIFGSRREKEPKPYNTAAFSVATEMPDIDWSLIVKAQDELNMVFNSKIQQIIDAAGGEVFDEEEIVVENIPFK